MKYIFVLLSLLNSSCVLSVQMLFLNATMQIIEIPIKRPNSDLGEEVHATQLKPNKKETLEIDQEDISTLAEKIAQLNKDITVKISDSIVEITAEFISL